MDKRNFDLWKFIGAEKSIDDGMQTSLTQLFKDYFESIKQFTGLDYDEFISVDEMITKGLQLNNSSVYFWSWLEKIGVKKLQEIAKAEFCIDDEFSDLIEYRRFILEQDIETGISHNLFESLADGIESCHKFVLTAWHKRELVKAKIMIPQKNRQVWAEFFSDDRQWITIPTKNTPLVKASGGCFYY